MTINTVLMVGGFEVGKTNYLIRLWLAIRDGRERTIKPRGLPNDLEYLNAGADALLSGKFAARTLQRIGAVCDIPLEVNGAPSSLVVPDIAGEEWMKIYRHRRWPHDWAKNVTESTAFLVFVRAHSPHHVPQLDWQAVQKFFGNKENIENCLLEKTANQDEPPTQVVIVDLIQAIVTIFGKIAGPQRKPRIGVVISAWDLLTEEEKREGPSAFLREQYGLLAAFLQSNTKSIDSATFGVSIVGGDLKTEPLFREKFLSEKDPLSLGSVWHELDGKPKESRDLALPVAWALNAIEPLG